MACLLGHKWDGCKCTKCGKMRDKGHDWDLCKGICKRCGATQPEQHDWNGCTCERCGKVRNEQHDWQGCKCSLCGKSRDEGHDWDLCKGVCRICGRHCPQKHTVVSCKCIECGKEIHSWVNGLCENCGTEKTKRYLLDEVMQNLEASYDSVCDRIRADASETDMYYRDWVIPFMKHKSDLVRPVFLSGDESADTAKFKKYVITFLENCKVTFGKYEQWHGVDPIEWRIVDIEENSVLLLSEYCLEAMPYHHESRKPNEACIGWIESDIRNWLNNDFIRAAFSSEEQDAIIMKELETKPAKVGAASINTHDRVFIISDDELRRYNQRLWRFQPTTATEHCKQLRKRIYIDRYNRNYNIDGIWMELDGCMWWLRNPTYNNDQIMVCWQNGKSKNDLGSSQAMKNGVRPALWLSLEGFAHVKVSQSSVHGKRNV